MASKRKRADDETSLQPSTSRRSTRSSGGGGATSISATGPAASTSTLKTKAPTKSTSKGIAEKKTTTARGSKAKQKAEELSQLTTGLEENLEPPPKKGKVTTNGKRKLYDIPKEVPVASINKSAASLAKQSPYTSARMEKLFATYADIEDPSNIGGEGLEKLCTDASISMEGAQPLILAWLLDASELGKLSREEWLKGLHVLQIDTLEKLNLALFEYETLLLSQAPVPKASFDKNPVFEPYNRHVTYWHYAADVPSAFLKFYNFIFSLAKAPQERNIDVEIAKVFWSTLLAEKYPLVNDFVEYLNNHTSVKGVNRDLWAMTLEFFQTISPSLEDYEPEGAWPTLLDEFVAWKRAG